MIIAITGGIGSGKSIAMEYIKSLGYFTLSADTIYNEEIKSGKPLYNVLKNQFGGILATNGEIDKSKLSNIVFSDKDKLDILNSLTHEYIMEKIKQQSSGRQLVFVEVPLLFESGYESFFDRIILITASEQTRINRVMARNNLSYESVQKRVLSQMPEKHKAQKSHVIIENNGCLESFYKKISEAIYGTKNL